MNAEVLAAFYAADGPEGPGSLSRERAGWSMTTNLQSEPTDDASEGRSPRVAFDAALTECREEIRTYLRSRVRDVEAAADLLQETYERAMRYRDAPQIQEPRLMLFRIANNLLSDRLRYERRHHFGDHVSLDDAGQLPAGEPSLDRLVDAQRAIETLKYTIAALPPKCRLAFMLSRFDGMTNPQVAARMEISVKMVEKHITRALLACRAAVGERDF